MSKLEEPAECPSGHKTSNRVVSMFATFTRTADGGVQQVTGCACACGGSCACSGGGH
jgi:hypothetical protein